MPKTHRQKFNIPFDQTRPRQLWFVSFGFCSVFIYSEIICIVYFVSAEPESSIPAPLDSAEEESEGELQGGQAKREQGGKTDAYGGYRSMRYLVPKPNWIPESVKYCTSCSRSLECPIILTSVTWSVPSVHHPKNRVQLIFGMCNIQENSVLHGYVERSPVHFDAQQNVRLKSNTSSRMLLSVFWFYQSMIFEWTTSSWIINCHLYVFAASPLPPPFSPPKSICPPACLPRRRSTRGGPGG
jgi:hypothetical protein